MVMIGNKFWIGMKLFLARSRVGTKLKLLVTPGGEGGRWVGGAFGFIRGTTGWWTLLRVADPRPGEQGADALCGEKKIISLLGIFR